MYSFFSNKKKKIEWEKETENVATLDEVINFKAECEHG